MRDPVKAMNLIVPRDLKENASDKTARALRIVTSTVGGPAGALFSELISTVIPNQSANRVVKFLAELSDQIGVHDDQIEAITVELSAVKKELFREGVEASSRATLDDRIRRLATLVASGLQGDDDSAELGRETLRIINSLSDPELLLLLRFNNHRGELAAPANDVDRSAERAWDQGTFNRLPGEQQAAIRQRQGAQARRLEQLTQAGLLFRAPQGSRMDTTTPETRQKFTITLLGRSVLQQLGFDIGE